MKYGFRIYSLSAILVLSQTGCNSKDGFTITINSDNRYELVRREETQHETTWYILDKKTGQICYLEVMSGTGKDIWSCMRNPHDPLASN